MDDLQETISAAQDGCADAFGDLMRATYDDTYSLALRLVGNADDAQDVAQDTYLRAFRAIGRFRGEANIATWLYRITTNCASTLLVRRNRTGHAPLGDADMFVDESRERDPEQRGDANELRERVIAVLATLPVKLRTVIVLRDIYDLPHEAIARQLGITESAAKVRLHRARHKLRSALFDLAPDHDGSGDRTSAQERTSSVVGAADEASRAGVA